MNDETLLDKILKIYEDKWPNESDYDALKVIEEGEWVANDKWQYCTTIVEYEGKFYEIYQARSGSHFTDYYYEPSSIQEVILKEETRVVQVWVPVK